MTTFEQELEVDKLLFLLENFLGEPRKHSRSNGQVSYDCPNCSAMKGVEYDGKGNLEITYINGLYNCWSCGEIDETKGRLSKLFKDYSDKKTLRDFYNLKFKFNEFKTVKEKKDDLVLPEEYIKLHGKLETNRYNNAFHYLYNRGITNKQIEKYDIGFCAQGKYQNRVVIPSYDLEGKLNFFVTRSINPRTKKFKYLNPKADKQTIIFNEKFIDWDKPVFIVEGPFDHLVIPNSIPLLGKKLSEKLFNELYFKSNNFIIIALDPDAINDSIKIYNKLDAGRLYKKVLITEMPEGLDVSSYNEKYGPENLKKVLQASKRLQE